MVMATRNEALEAKILHANVLSKYSTLNDNISLIIDCIHGLASRSHDVVVTTHHYQLSRLDELASRVNYLFLHPGEVSRPSSAPSHYHIPLHPPPPPNPPSPSRPLYVEFSDMLKDSIKKWHGVKNTIERLMQEANLAAVIVPEQDSLECAAVQINNLRLHINIFVSAIHLLHENSRLYVTNHS